MVSFSVLVAAVATLVRAAPKAPCDSDPLYNVALADLDAQVPVAFGSYTFRLDYTKYPESCENICFAWHCANAPRIVHPDGSLSQGNRAQNSCGKSSPNRCSVKKGHGADFDCDEWPWAASTEGGSKAATRCIPKGDNRSSGSAWGAFINNKGPQAPNPKDPNGKLKSSDEVTVVVDKIPSWSTFCKAELGHTIDCNDDKGGDTLQQIG